MTLNPEKDATASRSQSPCRSSTTDRQTEELIRNLVKKRGIIKGRLTKFINYINSIDSEKLSPQNHVDIKLRVQGAAGLFSEFNSVQTNLEEAVPDHDLEAQLSQREQFENSYYSSIAQAELMLTCGEVADSSYNAKKVHKSNELNNIEKFHYLKSSLKGDAGLVIDAVELSSENYTVAWELLLNRYNNSRLLIQNHVKALFNIQQLAKESPSLIRKLIDTILKNIRALKSLGEPTDSWCTLIIYIVVSKLDKTTERQWEEHKGSLISQDASTKLTVNQLLEFLKSRADMLETLQVSHSNTSTNAQVQHIHKKPTSFTNKCFPMPAQCNVSSNKPPFNRNTSQYSQSYKKNCPMCQAKHPLYSCVKFIDASLDTKLSVVRENKLCTNCLRFGHNIDSCRFGPCKICSKKHNSLIHSDESADCSVNLNSVVQEPVQRAAAAALSVPENNMTSPAGPASPSIIVNKAHMQDFHAHTNTMSSQQVLLSTALVEIIDKDGESHTACALLDSGSQRCFVTKQLCDSLNAITIQSTHEIRGVGNSVTQCSETCDIELKSRINTYTTRINCYVLPQITSTMPRVLCKQSVHNDIPDGIVLADPEFLDFKTIDILIGADKFWDLLNDGKFRLKTGPYLQSTKLGWIISGPIYNSHSSGEIQCNFTQSIDRQLRQFWELEELPGASDTRTDEERACEEHFVNTTTRNSDGRFCVRIPMKKPATTLGDTYFQAERRFLALEKRLQRSPQHKALYSDFLHEYERLGHMTRVNDYGYPNYFLTHHGVFREHSTSTRLRVVFEANQPSSTGVSINDLQMVGSPIQGDLFSILLRFRQHKYVACADIEKMYRQCLVAEDQRDLQLILWRDDPSLPLGVYRLNTITYGMASSAFMSVRCLKQLATECNDPDVQRVINEHFYVDDMIVGLDDKEQLIRLCKNTAATLQSGCFPLRKWIFNFDNEDASLSETSKQLSLGENAQSKTLGLGWFNSADELHFSTQVKGDDEVITKRTILSKTSQIFDALGFLSPVIISAKILLQKLWLLKLDWNDAVPSDIARLWSRFVTSLSSLGRIRIPRCSMGSRPVNYELHIFTDASQAAFGSSAYIRTINDDNTVQVRLLCSKGRVAPLKPTSIPRLELCGALLGARLYNKIRESLRCQFSYTMCWTDSTIVLGWLRMAPSLLKTFVQNRVVEIHELTKDTQWRHVSGTDNPADLVSRGVALEVLASSGLWWEGPQFLHDPNFACGDVPVGTWSKQNVELPEVKSVVTSCTNNVSPIESSVFPFHRFSQYMRMKRAAAYMLRFIHNARSKLNKRTGNLTVDELRESEIMLIRWSQQESYAKEYESLTKNNRLSKKNNLSKLNLFLDDNKIMRISGRLYNSTEFDYNKKHPILISSKHHLALLLFRHEHRQLMHCGPQALLFHVREAWWPVAARALARAVVHACVTCRRVRGRTLTPLMGNLPKERITATYPFMRCGVDYAGPVSVLNRKGRGAKLTKGYICLFICFVTRAVHLELVSDLTTDAYLLALKRFISRRSKPTEIYSDNATNFVGLKNEFSKFLDSCSKDIIDYATSQQIKFSFIPPHAPHMGGLWKRGVRSCKYHLRRVVGNVNLTFEEFSTLLAQIEAILNSRPLTPMSTDPTDFLPLSPAHFLVGRSLTSPLFDDYTDIPATRLSRYQRTEQIRQHFWSRWANEYISELQTRAKWREHTEELRPNTMVIIRDKNLPPLKWHMGRIIKSIRGKDGVSRVADIQTATGVLRRAYTSICPLVEEDASQL
ncbi:unnamed protein product [Plutella xylostella]|uniref:(diamondback moth) hypothetical protein n=1 Tax=Plutella xylostella TaxID=51655 RepID=A0A8S4GH49_PLUXY|nr:unnamed protein product [Plutella xylostella]